MSSILGSNGIYDFSLYASLAYDKEHDEFYIINPNYDYCYAFNIPTKTWIKRGESFDRVFNLNQDSYATTDSDNIVYRMFEQYTSGVLPVYFETKPINLGTAAFKKIKRLVIRGAFECESGQLDHVAGYNKTLGAYLWISQDGRNYNLIEPIQIQKKCNDIVFKRFPITCKYFVVVMCGHLTYDSYVSHIDVDYDLVYENKLR